MGKIESFVWSPSPASSLVLPLWKLGSFWGAGKKPTPFPIFFLYEIQQFYLTHNIAWGLNVYSSDSADMLHIMCAFLNSKYEMRIRVEIWIQYQSRDPQKKPQKTLANIALLFW